jgi:thioesterase domain-containing protein
MSHLDFDEARLIEQLERLPSRLRVTFAAACAERLLPAYARFSERTGRGDYQEPASMLERLWQDLEGDPMSAEEVQQYIADCATLIQTTAEEEGAWLQETIDDTLSAARARAEEVVTAMVAQAEDAATALSYAFECRQDGASQKAGWAAQCAYSALDDFVINRDHIDMNARGARERVLLHPLIQAELSRQRRDLEELLRVPDEGSMAGVVDRLHERAKAEASTVFG